MKRLVLLPENPGGRMEGEGGCSCPARRGGWCWCAGWDELDEGVGVRGWDPKYSKGN